MVAKAHTHDSMQALSKLTTRANGQRRIISDPPLIEPVEELFPDVQAGAIYADQNERDYAALQAAVKDGRAQATSDI